MRRTVVAYWRLEVCGEGGLLLLVKKPFYINNKFIPVSSSLKGEAKKMKQTSFTSAVCDSIECVETIFY